jgi:dolichol-phosphate mannosyltransferase
MLRVVMSKDSAANTLHLSVVIPLLDEAGNLRELYHRLAAVLDKVGCMRKIIFVDDGSTDGSVGIIREIAAGDASVHAIRLSRNFGHEIAITAGLDAAGGDATVLMDADLQDPPELIEEMIARWREGNEIVYAVRRRRDGESHFKKFTSWLFYRLLDRLSDVTIPVDAGDFRLIDKKVRNAVRHCRERDRFVRGLVAWAGFKTASVIYDRPPRAAGETKYSPFTLLLLSVDAAIGFSIKPLRAASAVGFAVMFFSLAMGAKISVEKIIFGIDVPGYALLTSGLFFLGGVQMMLLGILGEYIGRIYRQVQERPLYLVTETIGEAGQ